MMDNAVLDYEWNKAEVTRMDQLTQDYLHKLELELETMTRSQRATLSNQLAQCRRDRREHKDMAANLEPLVCFLESDKGKTMLKHMREALGKTRKIEEYMENRRYWPRVLT